MKLVEYHYELYPLIQSYTLEDTTYTGTPVQAVDISKTTPKYHSVLCIKDDILVTFFVLDGGDDKYTYTDQEDALLLRSFSTDSRHLRKGYAKLSLEHLRDFVQNHYPEYKEVVLGVNEKNTAAIKLYEHSGFKDTGRKIEGKKGPQKIFMMPV